MIENIEKKNIEIVTQKQKDASEQLFKINPANDKCLKLMSNGLLTLVPDNTEYTKELGEKIVELVRDGDTILEIAEITGVGVTTIFNWRDVTHPDHNAKFAKNYETAKKQSADSLEWLSLQKAIDKSGDLYPDTHKNGEKTMRPNSANVQRSRLQVESLDKITEDRNPEKYGNNTESLYGNNTNTKPVRMIIKKRYDDDVDEDGKRIIEDYR